MESVFYRHPLCGGMFFVDPEWEAVSMVPPSPRTDQILPKTEPLPFPLLDGNVSQTGGNIAKQARKCNLFTYKLLMKTLDSGPKALPE